MTSVPILVLVPAAGASRRMAGRDKLLLPVEGEPLLRRIARRACEAGLPVLVTLPLRGPFAQTRAVALDGLGVATMVIDGREGMAASLRAGAKVALEDSAALMVVPGDLPDLTAADFAAVAQAYRQDPLWPLRATADDGTPGHPVVLPAPLLGRVSALTGDTGARDLLHAHPPRLLPLTGRRAVRDIDQPDDWADWCASAADGPGGRLPGVSTG